jgi:ectoine hydroxylase-related dioxygenase (phytanoyl-CoA dioxygenase family)
MIKKYINQIKTKGYVVIPKMLTSKQCEKYKKLLEDIYKKYSKNYANNKSKAGHLSDKSLEKVVYNLHNKNPEWFRLFENSLVLKILDVILKEGSYNNSEPYYLNNISARCPLKGNPGQLIHVDSNLPGVNYNLKTNVMWYFDDVNEKNGTTVVVPKSHKFLKYADNTKEIKNKLFIKAKKGSILIFNANLWHGGSAKESSGSRWALALGYARWFIKPSFDYMKNTPINVYKKLNKKQKSILGFDLIPPKDEFTRLRRRSTFHEVPEKYKLKNI